MTLYHELCNLDLEQVYIDEIIDLKRIKKNKEELWNM